MEQKFWKQVRSKEVGVGPEIRKEVSFKKTLRRKD